MNAALVERPCRASWARGPSLPINAANCRVRPSNSYLHLLPHRHYDWDNGHFNISRIPRADSNNNSDTVIVPSFAQHCGLHSGFSRILWTHRTGMRLRNILHDKGLTGM